MACGCGGKKAAPSLGWTVDLANVPGGTSLKFSDGTTKKTFAMIGEANLAIAQLGLGGKVRPRPAAGGEKP